jgi:mannose-6-phosphate isomerase-like protein (cupin superfamily)
MSRRVFETRTAAALRRRVYGAALAALTCSILTGLTAVAQTASVGTYSPELLMRKAQQMRYDAKKSADTSKGILETRLNDSTQLAFRDRDGQAEVHQRFADVFVVLDGDANLVSGGTVVGPHMVGPGEIRGVSVQEGSRKALHKGDIVHIPAGIPHQVLMNAGETFTYLVVKVPIKEYQ